MYIPRTQRFSLSFFLHTFHQSSTIHNLKVHRRKSRIGEEGSKLATIVDPNIAALREGKHEVHRYAYAPRRQWIRHEKSPSGFERGKYRLQKSPGLLKMMKSAADGYQIEGMSEHGKFFSASGAKIPCDSSSGNMDHLLGNVQSVKLQYRNSRKPSEQAAVPAGDIEDLVAGSYAGALKDQRLVRSRINAFRRIIIVFRDSVVVITRLF